MDRQEHISRLSEALAQAAGKAEEARNLVSEEDPIAANALEEIFQQLMELMTKTASLFESREQS